MSVQFRLNDQQKLWIKLKCERRLSSGDILKLLKDELKAYSIGFAVVRVRSTFMSNELPFWPPTYCRVKEPFKGLESVTEPNIQAVLSLKVSEK